MSLPPPPPTTPLPLSPSLPNSLVRKSVLPVHLGFCTCLWQRMMSYPYSTCHRPMHGITCCGPCAGHVLDA